MNRSPQAVVFTLAAGLLLVAPAGAALTDSSPHAPTNYYGMTPPAEGSSYTDPVFGTPIRRLSEALTTPNVAGSGFLTWVMSEYSTPAAFNSGSTRLLLQHGSYFGLYDGQGNFVRELPLEIHASAQPRWSRSSPDQLFYVNGNRLKRYDAASGAITLVRTFSEYAAISGHGESDIGFTADRLVLAGDSRDIFVYDVAAGTKGAVLNTSGLGGWDSIHLTPNDNVLVTWYASGTGRYRGVELYDRNMAFQRQLVTVGGHLDVTRDTDGSEVMVWANASDPTPVCANGVVKVRLADAAERCLLSVAWSLALHISCPDNAGACVVETYAPSDPNPSSSWPAYTNELLRVPLDASATTRLAHHRSRPFNSYNYQPRASVSRDGSRVAYSSNFGLQGSLGLPKEYSDAYLIQLGAASGGGTTGGGTTGGGGTTTTTTSGRVEEGSATYGSGWYAKSMSGLSGGSAKMAMDAGSAATFKFSGTGVRWIGYKDAWSGIADVYLDGVKVQTVDTYSAAAQKQAVVFARTGLASGQHTLKIVATQKKRAEAKGRWIWVDAFEVVAGTTSGGGTTTTTTSTSFVRSEQTAGAYSASWYPNSMSVHSGGTATLAMDAGAAVTFAFNGTGVRWLGYKDAWAGIAKVYLDGVLVQTVDTYSAAGQAQVKLFERTGLAAGAHTLKVVATQTRSAASGGSWVWIDAFEVSGSTTAGGTAVGGVSPGSGVSY